MLIFCCSTVTIISYFDPKCEVCIYSCFALCICICAASLFYVLAVVMSHSNFLCLLSFWVILLTQSLLLQVKGGLCEAGDYKLSQTGLAVDQQKSDCLADLIALIDHIFQSVNCSSITKQELVHKIIMNNLDIMERSMY